MASTVINVIRSQPEPPPAATKSSKTGIGILTIAQIAIGSVYLNECPRQPYIPIYLIVAGVFGMLLAILSCLPCTKNDKDGPPNKLNRICTLWNSLTSLFLFAWFITGNVWIYSIYQPNYNKNTTDVDPYCNKTLYLFAFWTTTLFYILLGAAFLLLFCLVIYYCLGGKVDEDCLGSS